MDSVSGPAPPCTVCSAALGPADGTCPACGYPVSLAPEARRALAEEAPIASPAPRGGAHPAPDPVRRSGPAGSRARDLTADACARAARDLQVHLGQLRELGGNPLPYSGGLRQAALVQADGKTAESLDLLRTSEAEADRAVAELLTQRAQEVEARTAAMEKDGIRPETADAMVRLQSALTAGRRDEAATVLIEVDRKLGLLERDWRGLHSLVVQITDLMNGARDAGRPIPEVEEDLRQVRALLERPVIDAEVLDSASQISARALMLLHEALPEILESDLEKHGTTLTAYPSDHRPSQRAKALHSEISHHLRRSRLAEAAKGLADLRREIEQIRSEAATAAIASAPGAVPPIDVPGTAPTPPVVDPEAALPGLLAKARALATRVRALAPDSEVAYEAAGEIRRATELLRARKVEEAEALLTRLMHTLDAAPPEDR